MDTEKILLSIERIGISAVFAFAAAYALFKVFLMMLRGHMDMLGAIRRNLVLNTRVLDEIRRDIKWLRWTGRAAKGSRRPAVEKKKQRPAPRSKKPGAGPFHARRKGGAT